MAAPRLLVLVSVLALTAACGSSRPANSDRLLAKLAAHCGVADNALEYAKGGEAGFNGTTPWQWRTSNGHTVTVDPNNHLHGDQRWRIQCDDNPPELISLSTAEEDRLGVRVNWRASSPAARISRSGSPSASSTPSNKAAMATPYLDATCRGTGSVRPNQMIYFCADAGAYFQHIRWSIWNVHHAKGLIGRLVVKRTNQPPLIRHDVHIALFEPTHMSDGSTYFGCMLIKPGLNRDNDQDTWQVLPTDKPRPDHPFKLERCRRHGAALNGYM